MKHSSTLLLCFIEKYHRNEDEWQKCATQRRSVKPSSFVDEVLDETQQKPSAVFHRELFRQTRRVNGVAKQADQKFSMTLEP